MTENMGDEIGLVLSVSFPFMMTVYDCFTNKLIFFKTYFKIKKHFPMPCLRHWTNITI